ncbi:hypothetical protein F5X68DRAFT_70238 [Plectosphaerella plurivora]|uniref:Uncharacterized protein n=1 Tax=Plectosphaerella plurivora TaxID=936078 RepID=A0A9P9ADY5_9PEZI|nr:hypothetical protein F5X68DRAFT_70238 [Plectosphaerella plurivora]
MQATRKPRQTRRRRRRRSRHPSKLTLGLFFWSFSPFYRVTSPWHLACPRRPCDAITSSPAYGEPNLISLWMTARSRSSSRPRSLTRHASSSSHDSRHTRLSGQASIPDNTLLPSSAHRKVPCFHITQRTASRIRTLPSRSATTSVSEVYHRSLRPGNRPGIPWGPSTRSLATPRHGPSPLPCERSSDHVQSGMGSPLPLPSPFFPLLLLLTWIGLLHPSRS